MEIINAHVHLIEIEKMVERQRELALPGGISVLEELEDTMPLLSPETLIRQMDEAGIAKSVLYAVDAPIVYASNEYVKSLCDQFPERFIGFASVNPNDPKAIDNLDKSVTELGLRGLKLHPPLQNFYPNDKVIFPLYEKALELNIPIVFHVGTTPFGSLCRLSQADPLLIDDIAVQFPDLRIQLTHLGTLWHNEAFMVVEKNPNVFIDTAAYLYEIKEILTPNLIARVGPSKFIFGTDYPMPFAGKVHKIKDFVDCIKEIGLPETITNAIFKDNFETLLWGRQTKQKAVSLSELFSDTAEPNRP